MDRLFGGTTTRIELYDIDNNASVDNCNLDSMPKEKLAVINRYLKLASK